MNDLPLPGEYFPATVPPSEWGPGDRDRPHNHALLKERNHYRLSVVGFTAGGFEATVRNVDAQYLEDLSLRPRGIRKPVEERNPKDLIRTARRAKKMVRQAAKEIGCDHLLTITTREQENDPDVLAKMWKEFVRRYRKYTGKEFLYVAVLERHPTNPKHWHLHVGIRGWFKVKMGRRIWCNICGGQGMGNVDAKYIKVGCDHAGRPLGRLVRAERIAKYLSKYITKDLALSHRPDKKCYWRSEFDMPQARRYWLRTRPDYSDDSLNTAMTEMRALLGGFSLSKCSVFAFPDGSGFWLSYNPDNNDPDGASDPPPF